MSDKKEVDDAAISKFLKEQSNSDVTDFGYLLIPDSRNLNDEALHKIKAKFSQFLAENNYEWG